MLTHIHPAVTYHPLLYTYRFGHCYQYVNTEIIILTKLLKRWEGGGGVIDPSRLCHFGVSVHFRCRSNKRDGNRVDYACCVTTPTTPPTPTTAAAVAAAC